ncbi:MAG TPA: pseudouridine synthase [Ferruginibacter sp.]|nr:pseudouridine synthase [Ferruginibacter sp.]HMP20701.1 pseudouridine synthase [Ferruginibacter sp.]
MNFYSIIYKPFNVLSQFSTQDNKQTLKDYFNVPHDVYPVGRLDYDSEGLLILTNDTQLNHALLHPAHAHVREYWVQVDGAITTAALAYLQQGITISVDGKKHTTAPCRAWLMDAEPVLPVRYPPIRYRKNIPTSWIRLQLTEGKNRQVRKMTAAVGFPTLRLVRYAIAQITIQGLQPGDMRLFQKQELYQLISKK